MTAIPAPISLSSSRAQAPIHKVLMRAPHPAVFGPAAAAEHAALAAALEHAGVRVAMIAGADDFEQGCSTGSMAAVTGYIAIIMNPGAQSERQGEQQAIAQELAPVRFMKFVRAPARADGGDVVRIGENYFVGISKLTDGEGATQVAWHLSESGCRVSVVDPKSDKIGTLSQGVCDLGDDRILIHPDLAKNYAFFGYDKIVVPAGEEKALAALFVNGRLILPSGCAQTRALLDRAGVAVIETGFDALKSAGVGTLAQLCVTVPQTPAGTLRASA